jgi:hypothetical protein
LQFAHFGSEKQESVTSTPHSKEGLQAISNKNHHSLLRGTTSRNRVFFSAKDFEIRQKSGKFDGYIPQTFLHNKQ